MNPGDIAAHVARLDRLHSWWNPLISMLSLLRYAQLLTAFGMALDLPHARPAFWTVLLIQGLTLASWYAGKTAIERELVRFSRELGGRT